MFTGWMPLSTMVTVVTAPVLYKSHHAGIPEYPHSAEYVTPGMFSIPVNTCVTVLPQKVLPTSGTDRRL